MSLTAVVKEIVAATGYPAEDLLDGIKILPPTEQFGGTPQVTFTRFERDKSGQRIVSPDGQGFTQTAAFVGRVPLTKTLWVRLELACLADDPSLKGRKLRGGVELRNFHAYFTPEGEDQQWISNETYSFR